MKKAVETKHAPSAIGPYSQAVLSDGLLFVSGQIPLDPQSGEVVAGGIDVQVKRVMENLKMILMEAGDGSGDNDSVFDGVLKTTIYLTDLSNFAEVNEVYSEYFTEPYPARATVEVSGLPKDVLIEIDLVARV